MGFKSLENFDFEKIVERYKALSNDFRFLTEYEDGISIDEGTGGSEETGSSEVFFEGLAVKIITSNTFSIMIRNEEGHCTVDEFTLLNRRVGETIKIVYQFDGELTYDFSEYDIAPE